MKFGHNLPRNQVPEWVVFYINYKALKKLIKTAQQAAATGETPDLAEFFFALDRNLEDVDDFYNKKRAEFVRRLSLLMGRYGSTPEDWSVCCNEDEVEELTGALLDLRASFRKLQWFGEINRRGFAKITKKLDKKVPTIASQTRYMATKVDIKRFANDAQLSRDFANINSAISALTDNLKADDDRSVTSVRSTGRNSMKGSLPFLPSAVMEALDVAVKKNDTQTVESKLRESSVAPGSLRLIYANLLQRAISARAYGSLDYLLSKVGSLDEPEDINGRNCIHRLVIHIGRTKHSQGTKAPNNGIAAGTQFSDQYMKPQTSSAEGVLNGQEPQLLTVDDEAVKILVHLLDKLKPEQRSAVMSKDNSQRLPLHYAAQFGFLVVCDLLLKKMQDWGFFNVEKGIDGPDWLDSEGHAPIHLAVIGGHPLTTKALLDSQSYSPDGKTVTPTVTLSGSVLAIAVKANFSIIVDMLVKAGVNVNWQDEGGETALHIAARYGFVDCAKSLLEGKARLDVLESTYSWTPLHVAAVDGKLEVVKLLIEAGAILNAPDSSGWTAKEHAAFRGHIAVADHIAEKITQQGVLSIRPPLSPGVSTNGARPEGSGPSSFDNRRSVGKSPEPVKTFGHRYLQDESLVLVSLGSMDMRKAVEAVQLDRVPMKSAHTTELDTILSIVVSASGAQGEPKVIDLPASEHIMTDPIVFTTHDASDVKLFFDLVPTYSAGQRKIGRAVAMLSSIRPSIGAKRMNLQGDVCVPLVDLNLEVIGSVNFNFLVITPFSHPKMEITSEKTYWKKMASTMLIGHRGLGKNATSTRSLQLGENTVPSFIAAANLGAQYVEFDVQLTKDHVPVIYHDFLVSETGIDAPVHTMTLEQFLHINSDSSRAPSPSVTANGVKSRSTSVGPPRRSRTLGFAGDGHNMNERMKHTRDFKEKGYKGNSRGNFIQAPFATLEELFHQLPEHVGFNIEMKYPMLHESEEHDMDTYAVELNSFCDTVLSKVYDLAGQRHIIFSSFNPDICLCLSFKQPSIPIMFLTDAGICPVGDIRASSLQEAVRFASRWNLLGVVSAVEPFINSPRLVRVVKESGLVCVSYGALNNDPTMVQKQVEEGIDAVIVDSVLAIRKGLTAHEIAQASNGANSTGSPSPTSEQE